MPVVAVVDFEWDGRPARVELEHDWTWRSELPEVLEALEVVRYVGPQYGHPIAYLANTAAEFLGGKATIRPGVIVDHRPDVVY